MPLRDYQCNECQHTFEVLERVDDDKPSTCPACGSNQLQLCFALVNSKVPRGRDDITARRKK